MAKVDAWWFGVSGALTFILGTILFPALDAIGKYHDQKDQLDDRERDFEMKIIELLVSKPDLAVCTANLAVPVAHLYIHNAKFVEQFTNSVTTQAIGIAAVSQVGVACQSGPVSPGGEGNKNSAAASAALRQVAAAQSVQASVAVDGSNGVAAPPILNSYLQSRHQRIFFQFSKENQRLISEDIRNKLQQILGPSASVAGDEFVPSFTHASQVRYFYDADRDYANKVTSILKATYPDVTCEKIGGYEDTGRVKPQLFEVWLGPEVQQAKTLVNAPIQNICI